MAAPDDAPSLHPELADLIAEPATSGQTVAELREGFRARYGRLTGQQLHDVQDRTIDGPRGPLRVRIYRPDGGAARPVLVYFHGGGFVLGGIDTHDALCRGLCAGSGAVLVSVDYALAPEHRFPAGLDDCLAAIRWASAHADGIGGDPGRIALGGDSAGANLAIACALQFAGSGSSPVVALMLAYPVTDAPDRTRQSYVQRGEGLGLTAAAMDWFFERYLDDPAIADDPRVSPLRASDVSALPPTLLLTAEFDPLRDEGVAFAEKLAASGVRVEHLHHADANHGFLAWAGINEPSARGLASACEWLKRRLA